MKENCNGKVCGWTGDECSCNLGYEEAKDDLESMPPQIKQAKLREEFFSKIADFAGPENSAIDPYPMQRIADYWLAKLSQAKLETLEAIIKEVERIKLDMDVVVCDCGEPYKDSDPAVLVNTLLTKDTIELIEAEIERKKGLKEEYTHPDPKHLFLAVGAKGENFLKHITERAVRSAVDLLVIKGAEKIAQESATKTNPK